MFNAGGGEGNLFWILDSMGHMIPILRSSHVKMLLKKKTPGQLMTNVREELSIMGLKP